MRLINCIDCHERIEEHNDFEAYDNKDNDAVWDDTRKAWVCRSCANDIPYLN